MLKYILISLVVWFVIYHIYLLRKTIYSTEIITTNVEGFTPEMMVSGSPIYIIDGYNNSKELSKTWFPFNLTKSFKEMNGWTRVSGRHAFLKTCGDGLIDIIPPWERKNPNPKAITVMTKENDYLIVRNGFYIFSESCQIMQIHDPISIVFGHL